MIKVAVVGGTGYVGCELLKILSHHPKVCIEVIVGRRSQGKRLAEVYPSLCYIDMEFAAYDLDQLAACDLVFFATPHGVAMKNVPELLGRGVRVIDLSADFRLKDSQSYQQWYGLSHTSPQLLLEAVYGLTEVNRERIHSAALVANPGCYPTCVQLALAPVFTQCALAANDVIIDAKSGVSGAGRTAVERLLFCERNENFSAYGLQGHRHYVEIMQGLRALQASDASAFNITFVPHLVPMTRGIEATLYLRVGDNISRLEELYCTYYKSEPFVELVSASTPPQTKEVSGTNYCKIAVSVSKESGVCVITSVIDNLMKGAAGQAVQNMNLMYGLDETMGLAFIGYYP